MATIKLKPCPFCGVSVYLRISSCFVACGMCNALGPDSPTCDPTHIRQMWNKRADDIDNEIEK